MKTVYEIAGGGIARVFVLITLELATPIWIFVKVTEAKVNTCLSGREIFSISILEMRE